VIISVSNQITGYLKEKFDISNERIFTLYNPVTEFSEINGTNEFKKKLSITNDQKVILFMGRINYVKGYDKLINAYKIASNKKKNLILVMCGRIEDKNFQKLRKELTSPLIYIPSLSDNTLLYQIADLVILPSRVDPFPFVMIETGINKKPFIGGKTGGIEEFIEDGIDGLLVNPEDENEIADKILFILDNKDISENLGKNLYKKVKEKCDYQNYFNQVEEIYNSILSE
jgi:glycosyltransferase involved in cell wall biosynthesis